MQPERQIALACVMLGGALIYPGTAEMLHRPEAAAGGSYVAGGIIGSLGVFFGTLLAFDNYGSAKLVFGGLWALLALALAACMALAAWHEPGWLWQGIFGALALLPLLIYGLIGWKLTRPGR